MRFKKLLAILLFMIMSLSTLSACNDTSYILKAGDEKFPVGPYAFYAFWMRDNSESQMQSYGQVFSDALLQNADDQGTKLWQMIINQTKDQYLTHLLVNKKFVELGLTLNDEQKQAIETAYTDNWIGQYGQAKFDEILKTLNLTVDQFKEVITLQSKNDALINYYFGAGGENEIPESELRSKYDEGYARFKYIILAKTDADGNQLSFDEIATKKALADEALAKAQGVAVTFEDIVKQYSEDYVTITDTMTEAEKTSAQTQNTEATDNGLVIDKSGIFNELLYQYYNVSVDTTVVDKVFSMNIGDTAFIEISNSFWVIKKYDANEKEEFFAGKRDAIFNSLTQPDIQAKFTEWSSAFPYVFNEKAVSKYDPRGLESLFLNNPAATPDTTTTD